MANTMRSLRQSFAVITAWHAVAALSGCSGSEPDGNSGGGAGTASSAGAAGAAGSPNAGGSTSSAGSTGSAGATSFAGSAGATGAAGNGNGGAPAGGGNASGGDAGAAGSSQGGASAGAAGTGGAGGMGGSGGAPSSCPPATPLTGGTRYCSNQTGNAGSGYAFELWAEGNGTGCMTVFGKDATFSANWTNVEDLLARVGKTFDRTKTHAQIGKISAEFAETKTGSDGLVYIGMYGWTVSPLKEYYILDDWGETKPGGTASDGTPRTFVGTITVDGDTYDVWKKRRENKPAITGPSETFDQYFSIRQSARQCGTISVSEHFTKWEGLGLELGKLTEARLLMEAQDSSGSIAFTTAQVVVD